VLSPSSAAACLHAVQIVPLEPGRAVVMLITNTGVVASEIVEISSLNSEDFSVLCNMINSKFTGLSLNRLRNMDFAVLCGAVSDEIDAFETAMDHLIGGLQRKEAERMVFGGATNILNQPEFKDMQKLRNVLRVLEEEELVFKLVTSAAASPASVNIGSENPLEELRECSIITATYSLGGLGHIGVLGPTRMEYPRVMALLQYVSRVISDR